MTLHDRPGSSPDCHNMNSRGQLVTLFALMSVVLIACSRKIQTLSPSQREVIRARITNAFVHTVLFQPTDAGSNSNLALRLAPLIVQEAANNNTAALWQDQFGPTDATPVVECTSSSVLINDRTHNQFVYSWSYPPTSRPTLAKSQGVRLTLNVAGEPVIWEVLADSTSANILYVAQSIELAARAEFGSPLPGRKFSIERSLADAPNTIVANVIDDGPVPMGPVVYLRQESHDVSTLLCRCMASQGGTLLGQTNYELHLNPLQTNRPSTFPPEQLEQQLRLPRSF